jgi:predicted RNase H-like HicB family nuclease
MERLVRLHIERLPEGPYLATSDEIQGLVAQGRTIAETIEIARDVARKLLAEQGVEPAMVEEPIDSIDLRVVVSL